MSEIPALRMGRRTELKTLSISGFSIGIASGETKVIYERHIDSLMAGIPYMDNSSGHVFIFQNSYDTNYLFNQIPQNTRYCLIDGETYTLAITGPNSVTSARSTIFLKLVSGNLQLICQGSEYAGTITVPNLLLYY